MVVNRIKNDPKMEAPVKRVPNKVTANSVATNGSKALKIPDTEGAI